VVVGTIDASMRASDRDREQAIALLRARCAQGYVSVGRCDVVLEDSTVSRRHLALRPAGPGEWPAIDAGSLNGTWLSNRRVARAVVVPGDELWLGSCPVRLD
jgi:pSer/pThr/pTyr-binding forkhead associated (FHA) protein